MNRKNIIRNILMAESLLLVPFVAMFFAEDVDWNLADFIIVGILLAGLGFAAELVIKGIKTNTKQLLLGIVLAAVMILIWIELAVEIFNSPFAGS